MMVGPRTQTWFQFAGFVLLLGLAVAALLYANQSSSSAASAQSTADQGAAACARQVSTYTDSVKLRKAIRSEWRTTASLRAQTAKVFTELANLSPKASEVQVKILNLALAYSSASAKVAANAAAVTIPPPPSCEAT